MAHKRHNDGRRAAVAIRFAADDIILCRSFRAAPESVKHIDGQLYRRGDCGANHILPRFSIACVTAYDKFSVFSI